MSQPVLMPQAGQSMTEGKIVRWFFKEGDTVRRGEPILEIETDKANMDVECPSDGVLQQILHTAGDVVPVLQPVGLIAAPGERAAPLSAKAAAVKPAAAASVPVAAVIPAAAAAPAPAAASASSPAPVPAAAAGPAPVREPGPSARSVRRQRVSPLARRLARLRGVDLRALRGTGPHGRIVRRDVESAAAGQPSAGGFPAAAGLFQAPVYPPPSSRPADRVPLEGMRKAIAAALQRSKVQAPHFYMTLEIDMTGALEMRRGQEAKGSKISVNDLLIRALAIALRDEPRVNCRVFDGHVEYPADVNIGVAVGLEEGLVVPVVLKAQERGLGGIAEETRRIIDAARQGKLIGSGQGTFTFSNLGMHGVESFTAVINPPEGAILAAGAALPRLVPAAGGFFPRSIMKATLSSDHRAIDGLLAARFMNRLKTLLEDPSRLL